MKQRGRLATFESEVMWENTVQSDPPDQMVLKVSSQVEENGKYIRILFYTNDKNKPPTKTPTTKTPQTTTAKQAT